MSKRNLVFVGIGKKLIAIAAYQSQVFQPYAEHALKEPLEVFHILESACGILVVNLNLVLSFAFFLATGQREVALTHIATATPDLREGFCRSRVWIINLYPEVM